MGINITLNLQEVVQILEGGAGWSESLLASYRCPACIFDRTAIAVPLELQRESPERVDPLCLGWIQVATDPVAGKD